MDQLVNSLATIIVVVAGVCLVVGIGAYVVEGARRPAAQTQTSSLAGRLPSGEAAMAWISGQADYLPIAGLAAALILLIGIDLTWSALFFILALQIAYHAGLSVVGRGRRRSEPET